MDVPTYYELSVDPGCALLYSLDVATEVAIALMRLAAGTEDRGTATHSGEIPLVATLINDALKLRASIAEYQDFRKKEDHFPF